MPQDHNLYGLPAAKKRKKEMVLPSSVAFTSQLQSLLVADTAAPGAPARSTKPSSGREQPKRDLFSTSSNGSSVGKAKRKADAGGDKNSKLLLKTPVGTEEDKAERARARRKLEAKARLYAAMKRGDYVAREGEAAPLVDFDRKWAEAHDDRPSDYETSSEEDEEEDDKHTSRTNKNNHKNNPSDGSEDDSPAHADPDELVEHEDEFGRVRMMPRREKQRLDRRAARGRMAASELATLSARPEAPAQLIVGDAVQTEAFAVREGASAETMAALAHKRDRSATPPPAEHYDAAREVRARGVGFYAFSRDEQARAAEMEELRAQRERTERARRERDEMKAARAREIEERRRALSERRAKKIADSFLDELGKDMAVATVVAERGAGAGSS